ncbi:MAG: S-layer homology domain-containing protein, partial [Acidimicrobiaceae bacterium]|nr:S-layer homology domain-containing protein [Acidimicrobiaceae bacterium]
SGTPDAATVSEAVTFTTDNWGTAQTFTVTGTNTGTSEITHTATSTDPNYTIPTVGTITATITDPPGVSLSTSTVSLQEGTTAVYTAVLDTQPSASVTITATSGTPDAATVSGAVTFTTDNWGTAQTFTVTGTNTGTSEITHTATSTDTNYTIPTVGTITATTTGSDGGSGERDDAKVRVRVAQCEIDYNVTESPFADVDDSFAYRDVACLAELGVTQGTSDDTYSPKQAVTREQMAAFLARMYEKLNGEPAETAPTPFTDIDDSSFAFDDIGRIYGLGITKGTSDDTYSPKQVVTREQMAAFLARLYENLNGQPAETAPTPFTDINDSFAFDDIGRIYGLDITQGTSDDTYSPKQAVTREQMAAFLARLYRALTTPTP